MGHDTLMGMESYPPSATTINESGFSSGNLLALRNHITRDSLGALPGARSVSS